MKGFPTVPTDMLTEMIKRFPLRCPDTDWDDRQVWIMAGEQRVIDFLKMMHKQQNENILTKE